MDTHQHHHETFLACRTCQSLQRIRPELPPDEEEPPFDVRHAGHRLEPLRRIGDAFLSDKPVWDPMATTDFEVTNGSEVLIVRSGRRSVEEPIERILLPGRLRLDHVSVAFETDLIRRAIDAQFFPHALRPAKVDAFLATLAALCRDVDPDRLEIVFDSAEEPQVQYARMPDHLHAQLMVRCEAIFDEWERERLRSFFAMARGDDGLLCLRVTRSFVVEAA